MFIRELEIQRSAPDGVRFQIRSGGELGAEQLERELLSIVYAADPALSDLDGRLLQGHLASEVTTRLFVSGPDAAGVFHLGGIHCAPHQVVLVAQLAGARGFRVVGDV